MCEGLGFKDERLGFSVEGLGLGLGVRGKGSGLKDLAICKELPGPFQRSALEPLQQRVSAGSNTGFRECKEFRI